MLSVFLFVACVAGAGGAGAGAGAGGAGAGSTGEECALAQKFARQSLEYEFRCDYRYDRSVEGWLKYHEVPAGWRDARLRCHLEGTTLASPLNYALQMAIQSTAGQTGVSSKDIFTGIHATFSKGDYFSVEGVPLAQIAHIWAPGEPDNHADGESCVALTPEGALADVECDEPRPYVCYKTYHQEEEVNEECSTLDKEYVYSNGTGSCYKLHRVPRTWSRAHMACAAEGGYLAIVNGDAEAAVLKRMFAANPPSSMVGNFRKDVAFVGFHDWGERGEFLTINGQSLTEAGYAKFSPGAADEWTSGGHCGAIYRSALLHQLQCETPHAFICEKNPSSLRCDDDAYAKK